jgi:hypothetical protein
MKTGSESRRRNSPVVRWQAKVPAAHARVLGRLTRELSRRQMQLALANVEAQHEAARKEIALHMPSLRVAATKARRSTAKSLSKADRRRFATEGAGMERVRAELRGEVTRLRRLLHDSLRAGQARAQTVGDPTTFLCNFSAQSLSVTDDAFTSAGASTSLTRPVRRELSLARNRSRFLAIAFAPVDLFSFGLMHVVQTVRFAFTILGTGAATLTAHITPLGTYRIDAPGAESRQLFFTAVPHPSIHLFATVTAAASWPAPAAPGGVTLVLPPPVTATIIHRELSGWSGSNSEVGLLQDLTSPTIVSALPIAIGGSPATVTIDVTLNMQLWAKSGGTVVVDCLTPGNSGLNVPAVVLRFDF